MAPNKESQEISSAFSRYVATGDKSLIKKIPEDKLEVALLQYSADRGWPHYSAMERRLNELKEEREDKWWQRPLFVGLACAFVAGSFSITGGYFLGVQKTINNVPIQSNNKQYSNIYANQIILNDKGTFVINGTAMNQTTGSTVKFKAVSEDVAVVGKNAGEITAMFDRINNNNKR